MRHILTSSDDGDVKFPLKCKCPNWYGMGYRQPWGSGMVSTRSTRPGLLYPARSCAVTAPRAAQACHSLLWESCESWQHYSPGCYQTVPAFPPSGKGHWQLMPWVPSFHLGYCQVYGEAAGQGESIRNPHSEAEAISDTLTGRCDLCSWARLATLSHLKRAIGTPALNTPACCAPHGSLLASLKSAGCCFMGAGLCLDRWSRGWAL